MKRKDQRRFARAFGRHFRKLRIAAGFKPKHIYLEVGIDSSNLIKIEKGKRISWIPMIPRLARAINVHSRELLNFHFEYNPDPVVSRDSEKKRKKPASIK